MAETVNVLLGAELADQQCATLAKILKDLEDETLRREYVQCGLVEALRDLSSSSNFDVCSSSLTILSCLAHDNMVVKLQLLKPTGFLLQLLQLCSSRNCFTGEANKTAALQVHEQASGLLRKLVLHSECMPQVASLDVIRHVIELCGIWFNASQHGSCCLGISNYPPRATSYLHSLSHGRRLVGKVQEFSSDVSKNIVDECRHKVKELLLSDPDIPVLSVDLYDTTTDQDIVIREEMVKEGLAWPQFITEEETARMFSKHQSKDFVWADVMVTSVLNGEHFWAQVGGEVTNEKLKDIRIALENERLMELKETPKIGDLVCCKTVVGGHQDIYRAKVLEVLPTVDGGMVEVFALDYGVRNVVDISCLRHLPASGQNEPFQARFCCLSGVRAPPSRSVVLENAAGVLRNLAYRSNACRLQILEKDGVDALLKLCVVPDKAVCTQAIGAILNLSINLKTRARIGFLGGIKILLEIIKNCLHRDFDLLSLAIGALRNLMLGSAINRGRVADRDGFLLLTHVYFTCCDRDVREQCLGALKNLVGNSWYLLTGEKGVDLRNIVDGNSRKPFSLSTALDPPKLRSAQLRTRKLRPGEVKPKPIEKSLPGHMIKRSCNSSCEESDREGTSGISQDETTDGDTDSGEGGLLCPFSVFAQEQAGGMKGIQDCKSYYVQGHVVPFGDDELHELRECKSAKGLSSAVISRPACAFLNAGKGGRVYLGVKKSRVVCGVEIGRKDRDHLRLGIDELLGVFKPAVKYDKYQVDFVPVAKDVDKRRGTTEFIPDVFVIEVTFQKSSGTIYTTNKNRCYFRCDSANSEFSAQELRKWVIREQEAVYNSEIKSLKRELAEARQKLAGTGSMTC